MPVVSLSMRYILHLRVNGVLKMIKKQASGSTEKRDLKDLPRPKKQKPRRLARFLWLSYVSK
nr:MAG TPA_asm: hypothetical protein [Caudoviricetes sp.]